MAYVEGTNNSEIINLLDGVTNDGDTIYGRGGNDTIFGLGGDDYIQGGAGPDEIDGGNGIDTAGYDDSPEGVSVSLSGTGLGGHAQGDTFANIERLAGSAHEDFLAGDGGSNLLSGRGGDDILMGGGGADLLYGESLNDTLKGGGGADFLDGGSGLDTASYIESNAGVFVSLIDDTASGGEAQGDELDSIESLIGSLHADSLWGTNSQNLLNGWGGNDTLKGYGGGDSLYGGDGADSLYGMDGTDVLYGEAGADTLHGGAGADTMLGGGGSDTYYVDNANDEVTEVAGQGANDRVRTSTSYNLAAGSAVEILETDDPDAATAMNLVGNGYDNTIVGNAGNNVIAGGAGLDSLVGGDSADLFVWNSITEMGTTLDANSDTIGSDFNPLTAQSDRRRRQRRELRHCLHVHRRRQQSVHGGRPGQLADRRGRHLRPAQHRRRCRRRWRDPGARRSPRRCKLVRALTTSNSGAGSARVMEL
jgi:Ca2+-binding RTX toxin-like protein